VIYVQGVGRNAFRSSHKVFVIAVDFNQNGNEFSDFTETTKYQASGGKTFKQVSDCYARINSRTNMAELIGEYLQLLVANTRKIVVNSCVDSYCTDYIK
jgi:hypothetical protein